MSLVANIEYHDNKKDSSEGPVAITTITYHILSYIEVKEQRKKQEQEQQKPESSKRDLPPSSQLDPLIPSSLIPILESNTIFKG